jgi:hypothetical protein
LLSCFELQEHVYNMGEPDVSARASRCAATRQWQLLYDM